MTSIMNMFDAILDAVSVLCSSRLPERLFGVSRTGSLCYSLLLFKKKRKILLKNHSMSMVPFAGALINPLGNCHCDREAGVDICCLKLNKLLARLTLVRFLKKADLQLWHSG